MSKAMQELDEFISQWQEGPEQSKKAFLQLKDFLANREGVSLNFLPRPGVTYSLRAAHSKQQRREMFAMVDVIEGEPRWLSVCFYGEMISDPEERGDFVPGGLMGEDAVCFDLEEYDQALLAYLEARLAEAAQNAAQEG